MQKISITLAHRGETPWRTCTTFSPSHLATTTHSGMPAEEPECIECNEAKQSAEARAAATASGGGTLQRGECQPLYEAWTDCIKVSSNQATACAEVLKRFKACHAKLGRK